MSARPAAGARLPDTDAPPTTLPPEGPPGRRRRGVPAGAWVLLPQAVSRLSAIYVFAAAATRADAAQLGVLAVATAVTAGAFGLAPAVVGKPLAALDDDGARRERAPLAQSAAVLASLVAGLALGTAALLTDGSLRLTLACAALGVPAAMVVESEYWRSVFLRGRKPAGLVLASSYLVQSAAVTVAAVWLSPTEVVLAPFAGLALSALLVLAWRGLSPRGAWAWATTYRATWLPYVSGVAASVVLVQAIPIVLSLTVGLAAASVYRAGELAFGGTNLAIGVATQTLLTQETPDPRRSYRRVGVVLAAVSLANGLVLALVPTALLARVIGPTAPLLHDLLVLITLQRVSFGLAVLAGVLLIPLVPARLVGLLQVVGAGLNLALLVAGSLTLGLPGAFAGLAVAELLVALLLGRHVWKASA